MCSQGFGSRAALHVACQNGHKATVLKLLERQPPADIGKRDQQGRTPLYFACRYGQTDIVRLLLERGAVLITDNNGVSPIRLCIQGKFFGCLLLFMDQSPAICLREVVNSVEDMEIDEQQLASLILRLKRERRESSSGIAAQVCVGLAEAGCTTCLLTAFSGDLQLENRVLYIGQRLMSQSVSEDDTVPLFLRFMRLYVSVADAHEVTKMGGAEVRGSLGG